MLTNREKRLLRLLVVVIVITGTVLFLYFRYMDLLAVEDDITRISTDIREILTDTPDQEILLNAISFYKAGIELERNKYYREEEIQVTGFSGMVQELILKSGLEIKKVTHESGPRQKYVDFELAGDAFELASFLESVSTGEKYWSILEVGVENKKVNNIYNGKSMQISLRIIYAIYDSNN